jgi:hypothetical protein
LILSVFEFEFDQKYDINDIHPYPILFHPYFYGMSVVPFVAAMVAATPCWYHDLCRRAAAALVGIMLCCCPCSGL